MLRRLADRRPSIIMVFAGNPVRILWVKAGKLLPVDTGGKIRSYNILRHLAREHDVTFLSYYQGQEDIEYEQGISREFPRAHTVHTQASAGSLRRTLHYLRLLFRPAPFAVANFTDPQVFRVVSTWIAEGRFDVCVCDFLAASLNFPATLATPTVLFQHNVETALWHRRAAAETGQLKKLAYRVEAAKMANCERKALQRFHRIIAVSDQDRQQMLDMNPTCVIDVVPTGVDTEKYVLAPPSESHPLKIVFTGSMDWEPNIDAVVYFCQEIFPLVRRRLPSALFQIVGRNPGPRVRQLASPSVEVTGTVPSVADYLRDATVVVVPLRAGSGTRLKIYEAMAMGKAMVSSSIGAEGLDVHDRRDIILADDPKAFAEAIILLTLESQVRRRYELAAAELAAQHDWSKIAQQFNAVLKTVVDRNPSNQAIPQL